MDNNEETKAIDLDFCGSDPGAVRYGNFINYYSFHDVQDRLNNLQPQIFPKPENNRIQCLDVGCNTGDLTIKLYEYLKTIYVDCDVQMLAIDLDSTLIQRAKESNKYPDDLTFRTINIMDNNHQQIIHKYLESNGTTKFDVTFCFSVIMWIHINNGDEGLFNLLKFLKNVSGTIVLEPQPWKCYRNAQRRMKKSGSHFDHYRTLKIKSNLESVIENFFTENFYRKKYESPLSPWSRKIITFEQIDATLHNSNE